MASSSFEGTTQPGERIYTARDLPGIDSPQKRWLGALVTFLVTAALYLPSLGNGLLHWDDDRMVVADPFLRTISRAGLVDFFTQFRGEAYHPLHRMSYWLDVPWLGLSPRALHATNLLLWALAAAVWFLVLSRAGRSIAAAAVGTAFVALHPVQVEAVSWVTGRKEALALLFVGLSCLGFCARRYSWSSLAYVCAVLSKTTSLPLPLVFLAFERLVRGTRWREAVRAQLVSLVAMVGLCLLLIFIWQSNEMIRPSPIARPLLAAATLGHYARTALIPWPLSPLYPIWYAASDIPASAWLGLLALVAAAVALRKHVTWRFALAAFVLLLAPVSNLIPLYFQLADRYLSLPLSALSLGLVYTFERSQSRVARGALVAGVALLAAVNLSYQRAWASDLTLFQTATSAQPRSFYAWLKLGHARRDAGDYSGSIAAYEHAVSVQPALELGHDTLFYAVVQHEVPSESERLLTIWQSTAKEPQLLDTLASELVARDARNGAALVFHRMIAWNILDPPSRAAMVAAARGSSRPWVARAISAQHPASDDLR
jgi:protein O-mannosyl-transferase